MLYLIGLLILLVLLLFATFRLWRQPQYRLYLAMLLILDVWVTGVLGYLLIAAFSTYERVVGRKEPFCTRVTPFFADCCPGNLWARGVACLA